MRVLTLLPLLLAPTLAAAAEPVDVMLVLVTDVSRSVDDSEFTLEKRGYGAALADPQVLAAIRGGAIGQIAVAYVEFAGSYEVRTVVDWHVIRDAATAAAFTGEVEAASRSYWGRTSISAGIDHAMQMLGEGGFEAQRRVIDVAGDGTNNSGRDVTEARDDAVKAGVTVNGLAIINEHPVSYTFAHVQPPGGLTNWYSENVTGGVGSFVVEVRSFQAFGEAMTRKLLNEIADRGSASQRADAECGRAVDLWTGSAASRDNDLSHEISRPSDVGLNHSLRQSVLINRLLRLVSLPLAQGEIA